MKIIKPEEAQFVKCLLYGPSGHGKTHFLGTVEEDPRTKPLLLLDFEGGDQTLVGLGVDMIRVRTWDDYSEVYNALANGELPKYKSVGIDSVSETQMYSFLRILEVSTQERRAKGQDVDSLQQADYGKSHMQMRRFLRSFRDLPMHCFLTALPKDSMESGVGMVKKPGLAGQMAEEILGMMDVVGYLAQRMVTVNEEDIPEFALFLRNRPQYRVKLRTTWGQVNVPDQIIDPTATKLLDLMHVKPVSAKAA